MSSSYVITECFKPLTFITVTTIIPVKNSYNCGLLWWIFVILWEVYHQRTEYFSDSIEIEGKWWRYQMDMDYLHLYLIPRVKMGPCQENREP